MSIPPYEPPSNIFKMCTRSHVFESERQLDIFLDSRRIAGECKLGVDSEEDNPHVDENGLLKHWKCKIRHLECSICSVYVRKTTRSDGKNGMTFKFKLYIRLSHDLIVIAVFSCGHYAGIL
jgi:hypothetical protein